MIARVLPAVLALLLGACGSSPGGGRPVAASHGPSRAQVRTAEQQVTRSVDRLSTLLEHEYAATVVYPRSLVAVRRLAGAHRLLAPGTRVMGWRVRPVVRHEWFALCVQTSVGGHPVSARYDSRDYGKVTAGPGAC